MSEKIKPCPVCRNEPQKLGENQVRCVNVKCLLYDRWFFTKEWNAPRPAESSWRPIASAPKDGTRILLWAERLLNTGAIVAAAWVEHDIEYWHVHDGKFGPYPLRGPSPTHWMPLPQAPEKEGV